MANSPLVAQHQQGAFATPINGTTGDASVVLSNDNTLRVTYNSHDSDPCIHVQSGAVLSRPSAGTEGRKWIVTDILPKPILYYDATSSWLSVGVEAEGVRTGTMTGPFTFAGNLTFGVTGSEAYSFVGKVASSFLCDTDAGRDLGAPSRRWSNLYAAGGLVGDTGGTIDASAALEIFSSSKALLLSRIGLAGDIATPVDGMIFYDTGTQTFRVRQAGSWLTLTAT